MTSQSSGSDIVSTTQNDITESGNSEKENGHLASLSLDQIDIDDTEFDIPPLANPPTLESILNAPDYEDEDEDLQTITAQILANRSDNLDSSSISSQDSFAPVRSRVPLHLLHQKQQAESKSVHGDVFRHVLLKSISSQILSASNKVDAGQPTSLAVSTLIAVGMSRGLVLIFNNTQVLKWCLGSTAVGAQYGAVSALSFNIDCTRLLVGFARGQITMWNLTNGKLLRTVTDAHPPGMAILHVRFTDDRTMAASSDSGGSVFQLDFKRILGVRTCESHCLFSGSKGEACVIEPLVSNQNILDHPMKDVILVAIGTLSKMLLVVLKPQLRLHYVHSFVGDPSTLPLLSWQYVIIQVNSHRVVDPVLAFARGNKIHFAQVMGRGPDKIKITMLQEMVVTYKLLAIAWINSRSMVLVESSERAHLVDVRSEEELQVLDLTYVQLAYGTSFYKSLATGGNVSEAMAYAGSKACYNSVATYNHQLLLLGTKGVHVITLRSWMERINSLLKQHQYRQALQLGLTFYEGKGKGLVGLSWNAEKRKKVVNEVMIKSMTQYIDVFMISYNSLPNNGVLTNPDEDDEVVCQLEVIQTCITFCLLTDNADFLFNFLYDKFSQNAVTKGLYLESLESYIIEDKLPAISPVVMRDLVEHYEMHGLLSNLEQIIPHVEISCLDLHQIISTCWTHHLYGAILHVYNTGMQDYTTPLIQLIHKLNDQLHTHPSNTDLDKQRNQLGFKVLLYISCCLTGKAFPYGELPKEKASQVREQVLLSITSFNTSSTPTTTTPPTTSTTPTPSYPYLRTLIRFDTREFFNVLSIAFEDPDFSDKSKQRLVDILLLFMLESAAFNPTQIGILFIFLARQISKTTNKIEVKSSLFAQVLESLCASNEDSRHEERQQIFIELLVTGVLERFHGANNDEMRLVSMAEAAEFYRVVEMLHIKHRRFHLVLPCYWKDVGRQEGVFKYVQGLVRDGTVTSAEKALVSREVLNNVEHLLDTDAEQTARMVVGGVVEGGVMKVVDKLHNQHQTLLKFLQGLFDYTSTSSEGLSFPRRSSFTGVSVGFKLEPILFEKYIDLLCMFNHSNLQILEFLKYHLGSYIPESLLVIVSKYKLREVMCYLFEVSGKVENAFNIHIELLGEVMEGGMEVCVEEGVGRVLKFLHLHQTSFSPEQTNSFWFKLLDVILHKQVEINKKLENNKPDFIPSVLDNVENDVNNNQEITKKETEDKNGGFQIDFLKRMTSTVMTSAMPHLSPGSILERIISSPAYAKGQFGELRGLLMSMMDTCNYERVLMMASRDLACRDLHSLMQQLVRLRHKGTSFESSKNCSVCFEPLFIPSSHFSTSHQSSSLITNSHSSNTDSMLLFSCQHYYHFSCLHRLSSNDGGDCSEESLSRNCYLCSNKKSLKTERAKNERLDQVEIDKILAEQSLSPSLQSTSLLPSSLSPSQYISFKKVRLAQQTPSNMTILNELKASSPFKTPISSSSPYKKANQNYPYRTLQSASFNQKLAPPPLIHPS